MTYETTITFNDNCWIYTNRSVFGSKFERFKAYAELPDLMPNIGYIAIFHKKDDTESFSGNVTYFKTENGWVEK
jgi:hypothetical protein